MVTILLYVGCALPAAWGTSELVRASGLDLGSGPWSAVLAELLVGAGLLGGALIGLELSSKIADSAYSTTSIDALRRRVRGQRRRSR